MDAIHKLWMYGWFNTSFEKYKISLLFVYLFTCLFSAELKNLKYRKNAVPSSQLGLFT